MMVSMKRILNVLVVIVSVVVPCLSGCGEKSDNDDSVAGLIEQLGSDNEDTYLRASWLLRQKKAEVIAPVSRALRSDDRRLARRAGEILRSIGPPAAKALTEALEAPGFRWPEIPAAALAQIGKPTQAVLDTLLETLKQGDIEARAMSAEVLGRLKSHAGRVTAPLLGALRDSDAKVSMTAAASLGNLGEGSIDSLAAALSDSRIRHRCSIALVLGRFGPSARKSAAALVRMLERGNDDEREVAVRVLGKIDPEASVVTGALIGALSDPREKISEMSARLLGQIGTPAVAELRAALSDKTVRRPGHVALALALIGPAARGATDGLLDLLKTGDATTRGLAVFALGMVADGDAKVIAALCDALQSARGPIEVQMYAAEALGRITPPARGAIPALTEALKHAGESVRNAAEEALENIKSPTTKPRHGSGCDHCQH
jgi:HEAT repeat protein